MNKTILIVLVVLNLISNTSANGKGVLTFKSLKCTFSEKFYYPNASCSVKSFDRQTSTVNTQLIFKTPMRSLIVWWILTFLLILHKLKHFFLSILHPQYDAELQFKFNTVYRTVLKGRGDWCKVVANPDGDNLRKQAINLLRAVDEILARPCPIERIIISNFTFHSEVMTDIFPSGDYKMQMKLFDGNKEWMNNSTVMFSFDSANKNAFIGLGR